ncbi:pyruvate, phosphate dikinase [archaeon]|jgi:pyruvate, orthophosphate dikinase|nr:pyruvate, phosphate dikinase [archaeon]MBT4242017.1 pyruvate, phosphate dikinase [archaeon]MBT4418564.1 pyruvate, phosphate dikinase [archaeon]
MVDKKYVYSFKEGSKDMKEILGGKGANLSEMTNIGMPVPPGFTISTEACDNFYKDGKRLNEVVKNQISVKLKELETDMNKRFGDSNDPLLVSVRSGAAVSMPGMMDTVLNLGLNDESVQGLIQKTGNERFVYDSYRRFIQMFGDVVMNVKHELFEEILQRVKDGKGVKVDTELEIEDLKRIVSMYKEVIQAKTGRLFPNNVHEQLEMAINAVFSSWNNNRAIVYRRMNNIHGLIGTAVNVQSMVYGNMGNDSGTGVCFTRNPSTGENKFYGEFLMNAQGEDVVAGIRTPKKIEDLGEIMPEVYNQLLKIRNDLELHYKDMQDVEFTIQQGRLFILQTRNGKRTAHAAVRNAVEMVNESLITKEEAIVRVEADSLDQLLHKQLDEVHKKDSKVVARGLPASPGAAVGKVVFNAEDAKVLAGKGEKCILVRIETSPEDIEGMDAADGILTARGGMTSHAAVVARGMGKCCVAGCSDLSINENAKSFDASGMQFREGDIISLDGSSGEVFVGELRLVSPTLSGDFETLMQWADNLRKLKVRTNADTPKDAKMAISFGAEGIGLCRTEHMFFEESRIKAVREMILSDNVEGRKNALNKILPMQRGDFRMLFEVMDGRPVTIRFLDPPLHEFLPREEREIEELSRDMGVSVEKIKSKIEELHEFNPMLGHRGCRLAVTYPEIAEMQSRAVFEACCECIGNGKNIVPEVMIPLVGNTKEFEHQKEIVDRVAKEVKEEKGINFEYKVGTMIEVPRGAVTADKIANSAEFFSFGTNDLTQMGCGFSRDDSGKFLKEYVDLGIFKRDPFQALDQEGIGELMKIAVSKGKSVRKDLKLGICGEHGGEPSSIEFCHDIGLDYVSCSPFRVPIARLAAAQASVKAKKKKEEKAYKEIVKNSVEEIKGKYGSSISMEDLEKELSSKISPDVLRRVRG